VISSSGQGLCGGGLSRDTKKPALGAAFLLCLFFLLCSPGLCKPPDRALSEKLGGQGREALQKKQIQEAFSLLEKAVEADPSYDKARADLAELFFAIDRHADAIREYRKAIELGPDNHDYQLRLGIIYYESRKFNEAAESLIPVKQKSPDNPAAYYYLGMTYKSLNNLEKAVQNLQAMQKLLEKNRAWKESPEMERIYWKSFRSLGEIYRDQKKWGPSRRQFEKILRESPDSNFRRSVEAEYKFVAAQGKRSYSYLIYFLIFALVFALMHLVNKYLVIPYQQKHHDTLISSASRAEDLKTLAQFALKHLKSHTQLPRALAYFIDRPGDPLSLAEADGMDGKEFPELNVSWDELPAWIGQNGAMPFIFEMENKEIPFIRAFPGVREKLEGAGPRVGVPFVCGQDLRGIAFVCHNSLSDNREKNRLKRIFVRNREHLRRLALEVGMSADRILRKMALQKDPVTPAFSEMHFRERLPAEISACSRNNRPFALVLLECDGMGAIEKRFGEEGKNAVLKGVARSLLSEMNRERDSLYRVEGCRFAVMMPGMERESARQAVHRFREAILRAQFTSPIPGITASLGLALHPEHRQDVGALEDAAREALELSISSGRDFVAVAGLPDSKPAIDHIAQPLPQPGAARPRQDREYSTESLKPPVTLAPGSKESRTPGALSPPRFSSQAIRAGAAEGQIEMRIEHIRLEDQDSGKISRRKEEAHSSEVNILRISDPDSPEAGPVQRVKISSAPWKRKTPGPEEQEAPAEEVPGPLVMPAGESPVPPERGTPSDRTALLGRKPQARTAEARPGRKGRTAWKKDPVTGLADRAHFLHRLDLQTTKASQEMQAFSLLLFRIDRHKELSRALGRQKMDGLVGDICQAVSGFIEEERDSMARFSDEVFAILLPGASPESALQVAEQIRAIGGSLQAGAGRDKVSLSLGGASYPGGGKVSKDLLSSAYEGLSQAIKSGGNRSRIWNRNKV
jgi:diguanylate cyclase (GGDEF)-like protein